MAGIPLSSGFNVGAGIPLDLREIQTDITARDSIPTVSRYEGLVVYVISTKKFYCLVNGIDNSNWVEFPSSSGVDQEQVEDIVGAMLTGSGNISISYNDTLGTITIDDTHNHDTLYVPLSRTINSKSLSTNIVLNYSDVGAAAASHTHIKSDITDFSHTHLISDITNLQTTLDSKVNTSDVVTTATANKILKLDANAKLPASITGNAATATKLETSRTINGTSFDGTANITTSSWGTSRTITIGNTGKSVNGSANVSWSLAEIGAAAASHTHNLITYQDTRSNNFTPFDKTGVSLHLKYNTTDGLNDGGVFHGVMHIAQWGDISGGKSHQLGLTDNNNLYIRSAIDASTWGSWEKLSKEGHTHTKSQITDFSHTHTPSEVGLGNVTNDAQLKRAANDFNSFASKSTLADNDVILIEDSANSYNKKKSLWSNIKSTLKSYFDSIYAATSHTHSNYTPFASNSQTIPMKTPIGAWYRIATSASGVGINDGIFELAFAGSGYHQRVSFRASSMYNSDNSIQIVKMGGSKYNNDNTFVIQSVRVVYYPNTYSSKYAYVEVFVANPNTTTNATLYVRMVDAIGWSLTIDAGSIPTNYTAKELSVKNYNPFYNTNDKRNVITPSSGVLNIDLRLARNETVVSNITQNTTINISGLYDGAAGTIMLYLNGTYTITLGTMTNDAGSSVTKHTSGAFSSLAAGYYIIGYRVIPDASGTWRVFISISPKYS